MNTLLDIMSKDMRIEPYIDECTESYMYRVCYSALGLWCLRTAQNTSNGIKGSSKRNQTVVLDDMIEQYIKIFPQISDLLRYSTKPNQKLSVHIRHLYEQTGYLSTDNTDRNTVCNYGRSVLFGDKCLYFGIPSREFEMNGLGIFCASNDKYVEVNEFLIRDHLSPEEYFNVMYNICDFYEKDLDMQKLQYFDPFAKTSPSKAWTNVMNTDCTVARMCNGESYYRVMRVNNGKILFAEENWQFPSDKFTDFEYRRLYFALKYHYNNPIIMWINPLDNEYTHIKLSGHLPNREYFFLSLVAWPREGASDKTNFIIRNKLISYIVECFANIGIAVRGGNTNV